MKMTINYEKKKVEEEKEEKRKRRRRRRRGRGWGNFSEGVGLLIKKSRLAE